MKTSGIQYDELATNLVAAFPSREALLEVFRFALDQPLDALDTGTDLRELAGRLIEASEAQPNGTARLIAAARDARPDDPALAQVAQHVGLAPAPPAAAEKGGLENANDPMSGLMSPSELVSHITRLQTQVCLIELRGGAWGTGFLVGPNLVLTNYHVAESLINQRAGPSDFTLLFDYKQDSTGAIVHGGVRYALADPDWRVDFSPYHPDEVKGSAAVDPDETQLDYALLRTAGTPGYDPIGGKLGPPRGWLVLRAEEYPFPEGDVLHIFQHPRGLPIQTAYGTVIGVNANRTRVTYRPTTHPGSSGSPVLNRDWQLVALHHHGSTTHNQGIPVSTIRGLLTKRGHSALLDIPLPTWSTPPGPAPSILPQPVPTNQPEPRAAPDDASETEWSPTALAELHEALLSAFDRGGLQQLLYFKLGTDYTQITPASANYRDEVLAIVQWANSQVRIEDLVREGRAKNPGNPKLKAWEARYLPPR